MTRRPQETMRMHDLFALLTSFVKYGEIRSSLGYKIILEQRQKRNELIS